MRSVRDIKKRARGDVHDRMRVAALYLETPSSFPVPCFVRVHTKFAALGDMKGTSFDYAERLDTTPKLIFWREDGIEPQRNAIVSVEPGEAYQIDHVSPPDGQTITATVVLLEAEDAAGLPVPE
jgi:hypothetical protein